MSLSPEQKARNAQAQREYRARLKERDPELVKERSRRQNLKHNFGLTPEAVAQLLESQGNRCKICSIELLTENGRTNCKRGHAVDHCHTTGLIRGILCHRCNTGLGQFRDDPKLLSAAISYLGK